LSVKREPRWKMTLRSCFAGTKRRVSHVRIPVDTLAARANMARPCYVVLARAERAAPDPLPSHALASLAPPKARRSLSDDAETDPDPHGSALVLGPLSRRRTRLAGLRPRRLRGQGHRRRCDVQADAGHEPGRLQRPGPGVPDPDLRQAGADMGVATRSTRRPTARPSARRTATATARPATQQRRRPRCKSGFVCGVGFEVGPLCCKKICLCKDFIPKTGSRRRLLRQVQGRQHLPEPLVGLTARRHRAQRRGPGRGAAGGPRLPDRRPQLAAPRGRARRGGRRRGTCACSSRSAPAPARSSGTRWSR
jgi:hypothetical protein